MVFGINPEKLGRDVARGALSEAKRQAKGILKAPLNKVRNLSIFKKARALLGKGRRRGGRRRIPPTFFKGGKRRRRRVPPSFFAGRGRRVVPRWV